MEYFVKRGDQRFGPYSLSDLQMYVQSGNLMVADLAQSEGMTDWVPVSQVLGNIPAAPVITAARETATTEPLVSLPPNWHWSIVLILQVLTRRLQLFNMIWALVQANWAHKLSNDNKPLVLVSMYPAGMIAGFLMMRVNLGMAPLAGLFVIGGLIVYVVGIFSIKSAMEEYYTTTENIGLQMSGVMTFFFSTVYIQYHINRIARWKKTGVLN